MMNFWFGSNIKFDEEKRKRDGERKLERERDDIGYWDLYKTKRMRTKEKGCGRR